MKKIVVASMASCRKNIDHESKQVHIDTVLTSGTEYTFDLKSFGDADDVATIIKQASNFTTSEITNTTTTFAPVYHYAASTSKTDVSDQVILSISEGNNGQGNCQHHNHSTNITINFLIK
jgi:hypothetical protein